MRCLMVSRDDAKWFSYLWPCYQYLDHLKLGALISFLHLSVVLCPKSIFVFYVFLGKALSEYISKVSIWGRMFRVRNEFANVLRNDNDSHGEIIKCISFLCFQARLWFADWTTESYCHNRCMFNMLRQISTNRSILLRIFQDYYWYVCCIIKF